MAQLRSTLMPFLYPCLARSSSESGAFLAARASRGFLRSRYSSRCSSTLSSATAVGDHGLSIESIESTELPESHLDPAPSDYARSIFQDKCTLTIHAGSGGHGCVSFLREKYVEDGPANGGDGGSGGNIYIQAIEGQTSLHKLARRGIIKAGRGKTGQGKSKGGQKGQDVLIQVPVGTVIREVERYDPVADEEDRIQLLMGEFGKEEALRQASSRRERWVLYPGSQPSDFMTMDFPTLGAPRKTSLAAMQPPAPINLDLSQHMEQPLLLAAGAVGGLGNPHFVTRAMMKPKFATKGEGGMKLTLELELKLLADVGLVGLPNAGKSTLLRSMTNSRTRIGNWAFTTLSPNIGTVVLDNHKGRPLVQNALGKAPRTNFTIADIPGLIEGAHLDKGLGLGFLRHIERARILAFVVDLSAGDAIQSLKGLWREVGEYQKVRDTEIAQQSEQRLSSFSGRTYGETESPDGDEPGSPLSVSSPSSHLTPGMRSLPELTLPPIYTKPWFVVATKADIKETQDNFLALRSYLADVEKGVVAHPGGQQNGWRERVTAFPVSAINAQGVDRIPEWVVALMDG